MAFATAACLEDAAERFSRLDLPGLSDEARQMLWLRVEPLIADACGTWAAIREPEAYLSTVLRRLLGDRRRAESRLTRAKDGLARTLRSSSPASDRAVEARDELEVVLRAIKGLSPDQSVALIAHAVLGREHAWIANELFSFGTGRRAANRVAALVMRARASLRQRFPDVLKASR